MAGHPLNLEKRLAEHAIRLERRAPKDSAAGRQVAADQAERLKAAGLRAAPARRQADYRAHRAAVSNVITLHPSDVSDITPEPVSTAIAVAPSRVTEAATALVDAGNAAAAVAFAALAEIAAERGAPDHMRIAASLTIFKGQQMAASAHRKEHAMIAADIDMHNAAPAEREAIQLRRAARLLAQSGQFDVTELATGRKLGKRPARPVDG